MQSGRENTLSVGTSFEGESSGKRFRSEEDNEATPSTKRSFRSQPVALPTHPRAIPIDPSCYTECDVCGYPKALKKVNEERGIRYVLCDNPDDCNGKITSRTFFATCKDHGECKVRRYKSDHVKFPGRPYAWCDKCNEETQRGTKKMWTLEDTNNDPSAPAPKKLDVNEFIVQYSVVLDKQTAQLNSIQQSLELLLGAIGEGK